MLLNSLTLRNFRSYDGQHSIELAPRMRYHARRPIILFGGLNGAGKTTLLLAIKLALYGRHALGMGTSMKAYHQFLRESIHNTHSSSYRHQDALIELRFSYGKLGHTSHYTIQRSWSTAKRNVSEELIVRQDDVQLVMSDKACQGFLNELIPIGVSDLFFFDGEKIAELAEDDTGHTLRNSIQQLLGLHLVDRLRGDLRLYILRERASHMNQGEGHEIERLQDSYEDALIAIDKGHEEFTRARERLDQLTVEHDRMDLRLSELGGEWGVSRESWRTQSEELTDVLTQTRRELREEISGIYPLKLARQALVPALDAAAASLKLRLQVTTNQRLTSFANSLKKELDVSAGPTIDRLLDASVKPITALFTRFDVNHRALGRMEQAVYNTIDQSNNRVEKLVGTIESTQCQLDAITLRFEQAPEEVVLSDEVRALADLAKQVREASVELAMCSRELKIRYSRAINLARTLRDRHTEQSTREEMSRPLKYAERSRSLLKDFQQIKTERKIAELEYEFSTVFQEIARKNDLVSSVRIDPRDFTVKLLNSEDRELSKSQLSSGEKQILAIAMLDALARTSGRRLPVVIDTPLGRLDSHHRSNLVHSYFPRASHQVILLSTDVEVDEAFYADLSPNISHAFQIGYDCENGSSSVHEGYFWKAKSRRNA